MRTPRQTSRVRGSADSRCVLCGSRAFRIYTREHVRPQATTVFFAALAQTKKKSSSGKEQEVGEFAMRSMLCGERSAAILGKRCTPHYARYARAASVCELLAKRAECEGVLIFRCVLCGSRALWGIGEVVRSPRVTIERKKHPSGCFVLW